MNIRKNVFLKICVKIYINIQDLTQGRVTCESYEYIFCKYGNTCMNSI